MLAALLRRATRCALLRLLPSRCAPHSAPHTNLLIHQSRAVRADVQLLLDTVLFPGPLSPRLRWDSGRMAAGRAAAERAVQAWRAQQEQQQGQHRR